MMEECYLLLSKAKDKAKSLSKSIAINCSKGDDLMYSESLDLILLLSKLDEKMNQNKKYNANTSENLDVEEINKVKRKVPAWKKKQNQINSKILNAYFELEKIMNPITKESLEIHCKKIYGNDFNFSTNFSQMYNIASKNNAKVFDIYNGQVQLWSPVKEFVKDVWLEDELAIGKLVQGTFKRLFANGKLSKEEISRLLDEEYSKSTFDINYPVLKRKVDDLKTDRNGNDKHGYPRYYADTYDEEYLLCMQWVSKQENAFTKWADKYK